MAMLPNCFKINNIKYKDFKEQRATFHRDPEYVTTITLSRTIQTRKT
jgi:hypothetical protein